MAPTGNSTAVDADALRRVLGFCSEHADALTRWPAFSRSLEGGRIDAPLIRLDWMGPGRFTFKGIGETVDVLSVRTPRDG
jgi:hypothetical protein